MRAWKRCFLFTMILVLAAFTSISSTSFTSQPTDENVNIGKVNIDDLNASLEKMNDTLKRTNKVEDNEREVNLESMTKKAISNETVALHNMNAQLNFEHAKYLDVTEKDVDYTIVTIPLKGDEYGFASNLTLVFDKHENIISYSETLVTKRAGDTFKYTSYADGELMQDEVKDMGHINDSEMEEGLEGQKNGQGISHNDTTTCIAAVLGVGAVVAALIAYVCAGSCVVPVAAPICAACIGAFAVVGGGSITAIANCF